MLRTLHWYITRELLRVCGLALVAFTLVMTVFGIMEPLRKLGLAPAQVARLFVYTMPVMFSLTLPFAALFATAIVFGRFGQDREMLACRASGISYFTVLKPALILAVVVSIVTLILANFVSPQMLKASEDAAMSKIGGILFHKLKKEGFVEVGEGDRRMIIHASHVDDENNTMYGMVAGDYSFMPREYIDPDTGQPARRFVGMVQVAVSARARLDIRKHDGRYYASLLSDARIDGPISNDPGSVGQVEELPLKNYPLKYLGEEKPGFFSWEMLLAVLENPTLHGEVRGEMEELKLSMQRNRALVKMAEELGAGRTYELHKGGMTYKLYAPRIVSVSSDQATLSGRPGNPAEVQKVELTIIHPDDTVDRYVAEQAIVSVSWSQLSMENLISIELIDVFRPVPEDGEEEGAQAQADAWGEIPLPDDPELAQAGLKQLYHQPEEFTSDPQILSDVKMLKEGRIPKLMGEVIAEMHSRIAFGISCLFLVSLGAALGVIFKGGQVLTAFVISILPAAGVFVLLMMGKKMIENPESPDAYGLAAIWGGDVALLVANLVIYHRLSRK